MWQPWEPTVVPTKRLDILSRSGGLGNEHSIAYVYVFDLSPDGDEDQSGEVVKFTFYYGGLSAKVIKSGNAEFSINRHRKGWESNDVPLVRPDLLENLVEALKEISTPTCAYHFYFDDTTVIVVRELIVEPEPEIPAWNKCHITGKPHDFAPTKFPDFPNRVSTTPLVISQYCRDCHGRFATKRLE